MKLILLSIITARIVVICVLGAAAAMLGLRALDNWCASQLTDPTAE